MRLALLTPMIFCAVLSLGGAAMAQDGGAPQPRISVSGEGQVFAVPDMATITLGVSAQAKEAAAAMDETSAVTAAILDRLAAFEIDARDVQTSDLTLDPIWADRQSSMDTPRINGFESSNRLTVAVRDLDQLGDVLGAVLSDGANRLSGLSFGMQDPAPLLAEARRAAVADAMARAQVYAEAAGLRLGPVLSISEGGVSYPRPEMALSMRAEAVPVARGETGISATVNMVFALE